MVLNIKPEAAKDMYNYSEFSCIQCEGWTLEKMTDREAGTEIMMQLPDQFLEFSMCFQRSQQKLYLHFPLAQVRLNKPFFRMYRKHSFKFIGIKKLVTQSL